MGKKKRAIIFLTMIMTLIAMSFVVLPENASAADEYSNPIKVFKIGKKNHGKKFKKKAEKKYARVTIKRQRVKKKKLHITTGDGWEIESIYMECPYGQGVYGKELKNNKKFSVPKAGHKCFSIEVDLKFTETGREVTRVLATKGY